MDSRIVGLIGSPRKGMNTDTIVTRVLEGAQSSGAEVEKVYLNDLKIMPCQACEKDPFPKYCFYQDGMEKIYELLANADTIIIGTPAYFGSFSAQLKLIIDRSNCLTEMINLPDDKLTFRSRLKKTKHGIFIWVANISRNPEPALTSIRIWCKYFANIELIDTFIINNSDYGEGAKKKEELLSRAFQLGISLK